MSPKGIDIIDESVRRSCERKYGQDTLQNVLKDLVNIIIMRIKYMVGQLFGLLRSTLRAVLVLGTENEFEDVTLCNVSFYLPSINIQGNTNT